ncbi:Nit2p [Sugiyamaella lignohabitans]|uniref:Nit2p n=1 Tax=Sugiyamaella lignohabitans TaxID=796027 RepID=A0A167FP57_9ASCO|nr:Nit2p [Sugiyamaella lignohabitans]ANB15533.1 Nit2p [Sugiyamaella lignohabitans]
MVLAAAGQFCASASLAQNGKTVSKLIFQAANAGAKSLFLPEASDYIAGSPAETIALAEPVTSSPFIREIQETLRGLPADKKLEVSVGVHEPTENRDRVKNTLLWLNSNGEITERYQKIHLFDVDIK